MDTERPKVDAPRTVAQIKELKRFYRRQPGEHNPTPRVALIVGVSFNNVDKVDELADHLLSVEPDALIVCDDGSADGSAEKWREHLVGPNHYLLQSNDLHEIRAVTQAIQYIRSDYVCLYQDDAIPNNRGWYRRGLEIMDIHLGLGILGGWMTWGHFDQRRRFCMGVGSRRGNNRIKKSRVRPLDYICPVTEHQLEFCEVSPVGPFWMRRSMIETIGSFRMDFSKVGESGVHWDTDLCLRAWRKGWRVATYDGGMIQSEAGGTMLWGHTALKANDVANLQTLTDLYNRDERAFIRASIDTANSSLEKI